MSANFTELQVANKALARLAVEPLSSTDGSVANIQGTSLEADLVKLNYALIRDAVTEDRIWSFALRRVVLSAPDIVTPSFGFSNQFIIPADTLFIWRVFRVITDDFSNDERLTFNEQWILENNAILSNMDVLHVQYVVRLDQTQIFKASAQFIDTLSIRLAAELCIPLTENRTLATDLQAEYQARLQDASSVDGGQATREIIRANSFLNIRTASLPFGTGGL